MYDYDGDCPGCGVRDYGFEMPDVRTTLYISNCRCKDGCVCQDDVPDEDFQRDLECCCVDGCECDRIKIQVKINRIWDKECGHCGGVDWRPEWLVLKDGKTVATVPSENAADAVIAAEFPQAKADEPDYAWESERWLRRAEGWGC
jgi:hypothetical protein